MRPGQNNFKNRNRNRNRRHGGGGGGGGGGGNPGNRVLDSNGPDVKLRGTAQTIAEKYMQLARDAASSGDRVMAESYYQHADHYYRLWLAAQPAGQPIQFSRRLDEDVEDLDGADAEDEAGEVAEGAEGAEAAPWRVRLLPKATLPQQVKKASAMPVPVRAASRATVTSSRGAVVTASATAGRAVATATDRNRARPMARLRRHPLMKVSGASVLNVRSVRAASAAKLPPEVRKRARIGRLHPSSSARFRREWQRRWRGRSRCHRAPSPWPPSALWRRGCHAERARCRRRLSFVCHLTISAGRRPVGR